jgi:hypothetical protein
VLWVLLVTVAAAALLGGRLDLLGRLHLAVDPVPYAAVVVTAAYAGALGNRVGAYPVVTAVLGVALGATAQVTGQPTLLAGVSVATAVVAGVLAVMETVPAAGFVATVREVVVAAVVAGIGALAVAAYDTTNVDANRFRYAVLGAGVVLVMVLVNGLGAGLHGLGRRGLLVLVLGTVLLVAAVAYGEALSRWGTPELVHGIARLRTLIRSHAHAVPHPIEVFLGYPALAWGVFMRARRRQGWWVSAFGVAATLTVTCALIDPTVSDRRALLGEGYSLVLGLVVGYLVIRLDLFFTGPRGRRARQDEEAAAHRPEPARTRALR